MLFNKPIPANGAELIILTEFAQRLSFKMSRRPLILDLNRSSYDFLR
jgi:hypothetical protein